ncbi:APC family permease [Cellulomonas fengjieae]|uniref:Amino acid permease n=1 Tax=Cellulomonas fengjieae TaxID=2819978 RepID=A0ABS3SJY8_9CELL|nr:amino acid permease [Cellulomonas fengjieae]MBO3086055.1 amino acid permease [Cellulomonas fengjieae]QVI65876.1 amino acid permease [Cellulomonas fengjieae]
MTTPQTSLSAQIWRKKPITPATATSSEGLQRSIGTFTLMMFGVGATVGTGVFFVMHEAVPDAGPAVVISFLLAGLAAGLSALSYAEMASAVPVSGSTYSYAYATLGELIAMGVAACLLLEYGVSTAAVAVGWSDYLNQLLHNLIGWQIPTALSAAPWDAEPGFVNLPALILVLMCAILLIRGAAESATANAVMVVIKLAVLLMFVAIAFTGFHADNFADFAPNGITGITAAAGTIFFTFIGLDAISTAGNEVRDPQRTMPRAILGALAIVTTIYVLVAVSALGTQPWQAFGDAAQSEAGLAKILEDVVGSTWPGTVLSAGAVVSIFSVTLVTMYGQTRILFAIGRDGLLPQTFARVNARTHTPVNNTVVVAVVVGLLAAFVPLDYLWDLVSIGTLIAFMVVSIGVIILRRTRPDLPRAFKVPGYPVTPVLAVAACLYILSGLPWYTYAWFLLWLGVVLTFYFLWGRKHSRLQRAVEAGTLDREEMR